METNYKKRDRIVTPDGLGHIVHVYGEVEYEFGILIEYAVKLATGITYVVTDGSIRPATSKDFKKGKAEIWKNEKKEWNFRLIARNKTPIGGSNQGYKNRVDMIDVLNNNYLDFEIVRK